MSAPKNWSFTKQEINGVIFRLCEDYSWACEVCGSFVLNPQRHADWHTRNKFPADSNPA